MSNLLQQVAGPQGQSKRSGHSSYCACGTKKNWYAPMCLACLKVSKRPPVDLNTYILGEILCRRVPLTREQYALVSLIDYEEASRIFWHSSWSKEMGSYYAATGVQGPDGKWTSVGMSRIVLGITDPEIHIDHWNKDTLCNIRENLRVSNRSQNQANHKLRTDNSSGYMGVNWFKPRKVWIGRVSCNGVRYSTPHCRSAEEAARARDALALKHHGEFAVLNFPTHSSLPAPFLLPPSSDLRLLLPSEI